MNLLDLKELTEKLNQKDTLLKQLNCELQCRLINLEERCAELSKRVEELENRKSNVA